MIDKEHNNNQPNLNLTDKKLFIFFRGLFGVVFNKKLSTEMFPSSVTLLFPDATDEREIEKEIGKEHSHPIHDSTKKFLKHELSISKCTVSGTKLAVTEQPKLLTGGCEIVIYDGTIGAGIKINPPDVTEEDRKNPANDVEIRNSNEAPYYLNLKDYTIFLPELYENEKDELDKKQLSVERTYLEKNHFATFPTNVHQRLAGRVFRLRKGTLSGFKGSIIDTLGGEEESSQTPYIYIFDKHDGDEDIKIKKGITDTLIFETRLQNDKITIQLKKYDGTVEELPLYSVDASGNLYLLIQNMPNTSEMVVIPAYDYDFALVYRMANLKRKNPMKGNKQRRIPLAISYGIGAFGPRPMVCGFALYEESSEA